jgi:hypothetical protein
MLRQLIRDDQAERLELYEGQRGPFHSLAVRCVGRRAALQWVLEEDRESSAAIAALDALGQGAPLAIDRELMRDLVVRLRNQAWEALNALAGIDRSRGYTGKLRPPRTAILWLLYDAWMQVRVGERRVKFERDMRLRVKASNFGLGDVRTRITNAYAIATEFEQVGGRSDPMKPGDAVRSGIDSVQGWLDLFRPEAASMWPKLLGASPDQARSHVNIARGAALGCFATIMAAWIKPPTPGLIGKVAGAALRGSFDARMVRHHHRNFLVARGTATLDDNRNT